MIAIFPHESVESIAEQEKREESERQFAKVINRQPSRLRRPPIAPMPQVTARQPRHPFRIRMGNANRWD